MRLRTIAVSSIAALAAFAAAQPAAAANVTFERDVYAFPDIQADSGPIASGPTDVEIADIDGDTDRDIVAAEGLADKVAVLINNGDGTFQDPVRYDGCDTPLALVVGQLNLPTDTHPDVMLSCNAFLAGNGDGTFDAAVPSGVAARTMLELAELSGSGGPEVVFDAPAGQPFSNILCGAFGSGGAWPNWICDTAKPPDNNQNGSNDEPWVGAVRYDIEPVNLQDAPGEPSTDEIVSVYWFNDKDVLFSGLSNTAPAVWNTVHRPSGFTGSGRGNSIAAGDLEGDGDKDVVVGNGTGSSFSVFRWETAAPGDRPAGGFPPGQAGVIHATTVSAIEDSGIRDFDGDGKQDVALLGSVGVLGVHPGDGSGGFGSAQTTQAGDPNHAHRMEVGDLNGDGKPDAAVIDNPGGSGGYLAVMLNTTGPDTFIDSGPSGTTDDTTPEFSFSGTPAGATFECKLDGPGAATGSFESCTSPKGYGPLADGSYVFSVRAIEGANPDSSPASRAFTVQAAQTGGSGGNTQVSGTLPGGVGGTPGGLPGDPVLVETAPGGPPVLGGRLRQSIGSGVITVQAACPVGIPGDPCRELAATASVRTPVGRLRTAARNRVFRLRPARAAAMNGRATLRLRISRRARRVFMRALRARRRLRAVVVVSALDGAGQTLGTAQRTIRLRR